MTRAAWYLCTFLAMQSWSLAASAGRDNMGTEFIICFMDNLIFSGSGNDLELFVTTTDNNGADVVVTAPLYDSSLIRTASISRGSIQKITLPFALRGSGVEKGEKAVHINATAEVTVYGINKEVYSTDGFVAFPTDTLGTRYYAVTWDSVPVLMVAAVEDSTTVSFTFPSPSTAISVTYNGVTYGNGETLTVTLNRYETFHVYQATSDFSGTLISSDKNIAAFSGNKKTKVLCPVYSGQSSDHLVEMLAPVETWGKTFVTLSTPQRTTADWFRILAANDSTAVYVGGNLQATINSGEYTTLSINYGSSSYISADKPIQVAMYVCTINNDGVNGGDPAMTILVPTPLFGPDFTWSTVETPSGNFTNYIAVALLNNDTSGLRLDGSAFSSSWTSVTGNSDYVTGWSQVTPGAHAVYHTDPSVTIMAIAFGNAQTNSYAYAAGLRLAAINGPCTNTTVVAGDIVDNDCDGLIDEETANGVDDDGDGEIDEDLATPPRIDGGWNDWNAWGSCSVTCLTGTQSRTRECDNPAPANNGVYCTGSGTETVSCDLGACGVNGGWGSWEAWGACSVTCANGTQMRTRACDSPTPTGNGVYCAGSENDTMDCDMGYCPIPGNFSEWTTWSSCSVTCGVGTRSHDRTCDNPEPQYGGDNCTGDFSASESCFLFCMDLVDESGQAGLKPMVYGIALLAGLLALLFSS